MMQTRYRVNGVSLIEALVALAVMAFGLMGVAGLQASLRLNADVARQRAEAVRIAQEAIEDARSFSILQAPAPPGKTAYDGLLATVPATTVTSLVGANTTYTLTRTLVVNAAQNYKTVTADVAWVDRSNAPAQQVRLTANIHRVAPELAAALSVPGSGTAVQLPGGRHVAIPPGAVDQLDGTSRFAPPGGGGGDYWVFNNVTGLIIQICNPVCVTVDARLVSGFVRFATDLVQPTPLQAEDPIGPAMPIGVSMTLTYPLPPPFTPICLAETVLPATIDVAYFCVVPVATSTPFAWSGRSAVTGLPVATSLADAAVANFRVCRYTPNRNHDVVPNSDHPLNYSLVSNALINQNFLIIRAGNGVVPFDCPADYGSLTPLNSNTWRHQPPT